MAGWTKLAPIPNSTGKPMVSAGIQINNAGVKKITLILSEFLHKDMGELEFVDISAGVDENFGMLLFEFLEVGTPKAPETFKFNKFSRGGGRVFIPLPEGYPDGATLNFPCSVSDKKERQFVVTLPIDAWKQNIESRRSAHARTEGTTGPKPPTTGSSVVKAAEKVEVEVKVKTNGKLDMVEYLNGKGRKAQRLAMGRFQLDDSVITEGQMLAVVNKTREQADLPQLSRAEVF